MSGIFLDTNILIYTINIDDPRWRRAIGLVESDPVISVQCLNEFASVARGKLRLPWEKVLDSLRTIEELSARVIPLTHDLQRKGLDLAQKYRLSIYDGMIVAAALIAGCNTLYSEDMHAGLVVEGSLTIVNPFA